MDTYKNILLDVMGNGKESSPRGQKIKEIINYSLNCSPFSCIFSYPSRRFNFKYLCAELIWYIYGDYKTDFIGRIAKLWKSIQDENGEVNSNYGRLVLGTQYNRVLETLKNDKDSRQAIMHYNQPKHQLFGVKDFPCTVYQQFLIRNNELISISNMRSNDAFYGFPYDIVWFSLVTQSLYLDLKQYYSDLYFGGIYHNVGSMHIYEKMFNKANKIINEEGEVYNIRMKNSFRTLVYSQDEDTYFQLKSKFNKCESEDNYIELLSYLGINISKNA